MQSMTAIFFPKFLYNLYAASNADKLGNLKCIMSQTFSQFKRLTHSETHSETKEKVLKVLFP